MSSNVSLQPMTRTDYQGFACSPQVLVLDAPNGPANVLVDTLGRLLGRDLSVTSVETQADAVRALRSEAPFASLPVVAFVSHVHPERAEDAGVPRGPLWGRLQHGETVTLDDGRTVEPSAVVGPRRSGRKVAYVTDTLPLASISSKEGLRIKLSAGTGGIITKLSILIVIGAESSVCPVP